MRAFFFFWFENMRANDESCSRDKLNALMDAKRGEKMQKCKNEKRSVSVEDSDNKWTRFHPMFSGTLAHR